MLLAFLLVASAHAAEGPAEWAEMYDARLIEVADANSTVVAENLDSILARLAPEDSLRGDVAYWLAHARLALGDPDGARQALNEAKAMPHTRDAALAFSAQIDSIERLVTATPIHVGFDHGVDPLIHDWQHASQGSIETAVPDSPPGDPSGPALRWITRIQETEHDEVLLNLANTACPLRAIRVRLRAEDFPAFVRFRALDEAGQEYVTDDWLIPTSHWVQVEVPLAEFSATSLGERRFHPASRSVRSLRIQNITAWMSADRGKQVLWLDDLEVW